VVECPIIDRCSTIGRLSIEPPFPFTGPLNLVEDRFVAYPTAGQQQANVGVRVILMDRIPRPDRSKFIAAQKNHNGNERIANAKILCGVGAISVKYSDVRTCGLPALVNNLLFCGSLLASLAVMFEFAAASRSENMRPFECPVRAMIDVVDGKWKPMIINYLKSGALRSGQLQRKIPDAPRKVLTEQLRELEAAKIISRKVSGEKSQRTDYSLSDYGRTLVPILTLMAAWGDKHMKLSQ
jgi:DNA-binding HxlR family transcriptional regulator